MSQPWTTGPGHTYLGFSKKPGATSPPGLPQSIGTPIYLGAFQSRPRIQIRPHFKPVFSDIGGPDVPHDHIYTGRDGIFSGPMTVWNWPPMLQSMSRPNYASPALAGGPPNSFLTDEYGSMGALMTAEGFAYHLWVQFPYALKAAYAGMGMISGLHFSNVWLMGPDEFEMGTDVNTIQVQFYLGRTYKASTGAWTLGDTNMAGIPAFPPATATGI